MDGVVILFLVFVAAYAINPWCPVPRQEAVMLALSAVVLAVTMVLTRSKNRQEHFAVAEKEHYVPIATEEDVSALTSKVNGLFLYLTAFHPPSVPSNGKIWKNAIADTKAPMDFTFDNAPIISPTSGASMKSNRLTGPFGSDLPIQLQNSFTIVLALKNGDFVPNPDSEIELLKLYANSSNNNGLSLFIRKGSVVIEDGVQKGQLQLLYVDSGNSMDCRLPNTANFIFDKHNLTYIFIIKELHKIRVLYMTGSQTQKSIRVLLEVALPETAATLSNKEMVINRFRNWQGDLYVMAMLQQAITDDAVMTIYNHIDSEYQKNIYGATSNIIKSYNSLVESWRKKTSCPFEKAVCDTCSTIQDWTQLQHLLQSPSECRKAIATFCQKNVNHPLCQCWDATASAQYKSPTCTSYRQIFEGGNPASAALANLNQEDLNKVMKKYDLVYAAEAKPAASASATAACSAPLVNNTYKPVDPDAVKVSLGKPRHIVLSDSEIQDPYSMKLPGAGLEFMKKSSASGSTQASRIKNPYAKPSEAGSSGGRLTGIADKIKAWLKPEA